MTVARTRISKIRLKPSFLDADPRTWWCATKLECLATENGLTVPAFFSAYAGKNLRPWEIQPRGTFVRQA